MKKFIVRREEVRRIYENVFIEVEAENVEEAQKKAEEGLGEAVEWEITNDEFLFYNSPCTEWETSESLK